MQPCLHGLKDNLTTGTTHRWNGKVDGLNIRLPLSQKIRVQSQALSVCHHTARRNPQPHSTHPPKQLFMLCFVSHPLSCAI